MLTGFPRKGCRRWASWLLLGAISFSSLSGCSRQFWRKQAERDTYRAITQKLNNPHWQVPRISLTPDARSRFHDPHNPDCAPLPPDDPSAHEMMHCVNGFKGYKSWHKFGTALSIENPQWLEPFGIAVQGADPVIGHSEVKLTDVTLPQAVELAYIHSRDYQTQLEDLYLTALQLTFQRYALGVRFLGPGGVEPGVDVSTFTDRNGTTDGAVSSNFGVRQLLPTGGQIAVELANEIGFVFGSNGGFSASALSYSITQPLMFAAGRKIALEPLTQAERNVLYQARVLARFRQTLFTDIATDYLDLLVQQQAILNQENNIRQLTEQLNAQRAQDSRTLNLFTATLETMPPGTQIPPELAGKLSYNDGFLKFIGSMTEEDQALLIGLSDDEQYQSAADTLISLARNESTPLSQAELIATLNQRQNQLESFKLGLARELDNFKFNLGLPPNIELEIDRSLLTQFQLISTSLINTEKKFRDLDIELGFAVLPDENSADPEAYQAFRKYLAELMILRDELYETGLVVVQQDFEPLRDALQVTEENWQATEFGKRFFLTEEERDRVVKAVDGDLRSYRTTEREFAFQSSLLDMLSELLQEDSPEAMLRKLDQDQNGLISIAELPDRWLDLPKAEKRGRTNDGMGGQPPLPGDEIANTEGELTILEVLNTARTATKILKTEFNRNAQELEVLQAGLRAEAVPLNPFFLEGSEKQPDIEEVVRIGLEQRHDLMNARAEVMDRRRAVEIAANALEAGLDLRFTGTQGLDKRTENLTAYRAGLKFTTPLDQIDERNVYNLRLIEYQRERRAYMQLEDLIKNQIRQNWRQIQVQALRVEIDRQTIRNAARLYDNASLIAARGTQQNALSLLNALNSILNAQNSLVNDWNTYETNRLNIFRDMGIMQIDSRGVWLDRFYMQMDGVPAVNQQTDVPPAPVTEMIPDADPSNSPPPNQ